MFTKWLDTFIAEKGIDTETVLTVEGASGANYIPLGCLVDAIKSAPATEQRAIKHTIVRLDFINAPVLPYFGHLARAIAL
jgi:hypothetical protein